MDYNSQRALRTLRGLHVPGHSRGRGGAEGWGSLRVGAPSPPLTSALLQEPRSPLSAHFPVHWSLKVNGACSLAGPVSPRTLRGDVSSGRERGEAPQTQRPANPGPGRSRSRGRCPSLADSAHPAAQGLPAPALLGSEWAWRRGGESRGLSGVRGGQGEGLGRCGQALRGSPGLKSAVPECGGGRHGLGSSAALRLAFCK